VSAVLLSRSRGCALVVALLLGAPGSAVAQSAGDDQYDDPFGDEPAQSEGGGDDTGSGSDGADRSEGSTGGGGSSPGSESSGSGAAAGTGAGAETGTAPSATASGVQGDGAQLPRTGGAAGVLLAAGAVLLAGGAVLRVRLREPR